MTLARQTTDKVIYLTAGAGGMFCGSCLHDNALSKALFDHGWDIQLIPVYTPIRTDESDFSVDRVMFGGLNVYLQQKIPLFRYLPAFLDRFLDSPWLIRKVTSRAMETDPTMLGKLTLSMLMGQQGNQRKEVRQLVKWLTLIDPRLIIFSNVLVGGCVPAIKQAIGAAIMVTLQGDNVFLDSLRPLYRQQCIDRIREISQQVDGFIVQSNFFRDYMSDYFSIAREKFIVVPLGIEVSDYQPDRQPTADPTQAIGYLARLAPEKGLHHLVDGFIDLKRRPDTDSVRLKIAGWVSPEHRQYARQQLARLDAAGLSDAYENLGVVDRPSKLKFLREIDVFSVPTEYQEPKGRYALEAMASGVPVVLPDHGAFTELLQQSGGGVLVPPGDSQKLADQWLRLLGDDALRSQLGDAGRRFILESRNEKTMAQSTALAINEFLGW